MEEFSDSLEFENAEQKKRQIIILESLKSNKVVLAHQRCWPGSCAATVDRFLRWVVQASTTTLAFDSKGG